MEQMDDTIPDMAANAVDYNTPDSIPDVNMGKLWDTTAMGLPEVHVQSVTLTSKSRAHYIV